MSRGDAGGPGERPVRKSAPPRRATLRRSASVLLIELDSRRNRGRGRDRKNLAHVDGDARRAAPDLRLETTGLEVLLKDPLLLVAAAERDVRDAASGGNGAVDQHARPRV